MAFHYRQEIIKSIVEKSFINFMINFGLCFTKSTYKVKYFGNLSNTQAMKLFPCSLSF